MSDKYVLVIIIQIQKWIVNKSFSYLLFWVLFFYVL